MKKVGIFLHQIKNDTKSIDGFDYDFIKKLQKYDVSIIGIPFSYEKDSFEKIKPLLDLCDGLIVPGGNLETTLEKDSILYFHQLDKPVLGICLGMQMMCMAFNGEITKMDTDRHCSLDTYVHSVKINNNSKLYSIIHKDCFKVNSRHHFKVVNTSLPVVAYADDDVIEAVEDSNKKCFLGIQWHPENLEDEVSLKLFEYFIDCL